MTAQQLRNSILQQAIQGRLVPQDPNDEPICLPKISSVNEEDKEFTTPSNWVWCQLGDVIKISSGDGLTSKQMHGGTIPVYGGNGITGYHDEFNVSAPTVVIGRVGFYCGSVHLTEKYAWITDNAFKTYYSDSVFDTNYLVHFLRYLNLGRHHNATAQPVVSGKKIYPIAISIPPLAEQRRIVAKIEELMPLVEKYGKAQTELDTLNQDLPRRLRQSVLQQAIQGKLVEQDEKDEPSIDVMNLLLSAKKNSGQKKLTFGEAVTEDEIPFDIPSTWSWIRLGDIVYNQTGLAYSKGDLEKKVSNPVRVLRGGNIQNGAWCTKVDDVMIAPEFVKKDIFLKKNTFITPAVTSLEHLGKTALIKEDHPDIVAGGFVLYLIPYYRDCDTFVEYLSYFFQSGFYNKFCKTITNKSGQAFWNISRQKLMDLPIPLPPLAEQRRIVAKIEELFAEIDKLK